MCGRKALLKGGTSKKGIIWYLVRGKIQVQYIATASETIIYGLACSKYSLLCCAQWYTTNGKWWDTTSKYTRVMIHNKRVMMNGGNYIRVMRQERGDRLVGARASYWLTPDSCSVLTHRWLTNDSILTHRWLTNDSILGARAAHTQYTYILWAHS